MLDKQRLRTFLLGGAAGILAGILLAPRSGRELRDSLTNRAGEARERGRETYFDAQERMRERMADVREGTRRPPDAAAEAEDPNPFAEEAPWPRLRDVSHGVDAQVADEAIGREAGQDAERSEELRRKVRETRDRLRGRQDLDPESER